MSSQGSRVQNPASVKGALRTINDKKSVSRRSAGRIDSDARTISFQGGRPCRATAATAAHARSGPFAVLRIISVEKMPTAPVPPNESHRVGGLKPPQRFAQGASTALHQQVVVVVHEHEGMDFGAEALGQLRDQAKKSAAVFLPAVDVLAAIPPAHHVIPSVDDVDPKRSSHGFNF